MNEIEFVTTELSKKEDVLQDTHDIEENKQVPLVNSFIFLLIQHKNK